MGISPSDSLTKPFAWLTGANGLLGNYLICQDEVTNLFEPFQKGSVDVLMSLREFSEYFLQ